MVSNSTTMYLGDILVPQYLHLPFKNNQANTGILSYHASLWLHVGQNDLGFARLIPFGKR